MSQTAPHTRRTIWVDLLLYPTHSLPTAAAPVLVGVGLALSHHVFALLPALVGFLSSWFIHIAGLFLDNYQLLTKHPEVREHPELNEAMESGSLTRAALIAAVLGSLLLSLLPAPYLYPIGGWPVVVLGVVGILSSVTYAAGPVPMTRYGIADPVFVIMYGVVAEWGTYYIQAAAHGAGGAWISAMASIPWTVYVLGLPVGAMVTAVMVIDDIRDREFDRIKGWRTTAVCLGVRWSRIEFVGFYVIAYSAPLFFWLALGLGASVLLPLLTLPLGYKLARAVATIERREELVPMTPKAAMLALFYGLLSGIGLAFA